MTAGEATTGHRFKGRIADVFQEPLSRTEDDGNYVEVQLIVHRAHRTAGRTTEPMTSGRLERTSKIFRPGVDPNPMVSTNKKVERQCRLRA